MEGFFAPPCIQKFHFWFTLYLKVYNFVHPSPPNCQVKEFPIILHNGYFLEQTNII